MSQISPKKAYIFRITHIDNVPWLLENGIHCRNSDQRDPNFHEIGNPDLIDKRIHRVVPISPGGTLGDYVPFYFTYHSPMLYNIKTGFGGVRQTPMSEIVFLVSSLRRFAELNLSFVFTDRHAYLHTAQFRSDLTDLELLDWTILQKHDFRRDSNDPGKFERYQAEALIYHSAPLSSILGIVCYSPHEEIQLRGFLDAAGISLKIAVRPDWYFQ